MSDKFYYNDGLAINPSAVWTNLQILVIVEKSAVQSVEAGTDGLVEVGAAGAPSSANGLCILTQNNINQKIYLMFWCSICSLALTRSHC